MEIVIVLSGKDMEWDKIETYLRFDKKKYAKVENLEVLKSRFRAIKEYFSDKQFTRDTFIDYLKTLENRGLQPATLNGYIKVAKHINKVYKLHELDDFSYFKEPWTEVVPFTAQEVDKISKVVLPYQRLAEERNHRDYVAIQFLFGAGARIGDLKHLLWEDVRNAPIYHVVFRDINTKNGDRHELAISERIYNLLMSMPHYGERVFDSRNGKLFERTEFNKNLKRRVEIAGIQKVITRKSHIFRHSRAAQLADMGFDDSQIGQLLNHKDEKTTKRYTHRNLEATVSAAYASPLEKEGAFNSLIELGRKQLQKIYDKNLYKIVVDIVDGIPIWKAIPINKVSPDIV